MQKRLTKLFGVMESSLKSKHILLLGVVLLLVSVVQNFVLILMMSKIQALFFLPSYEVIAKSLVNDIVKSFNVQVLDIVNVVEKKPELSSWEKSKELLYSFYKKEYFGATLLLGTVVSLFIFYPQPIYVVLEDLRTFFRIVSDPLLDLASGVHTAFGAGFGYIYSSSEVCRSYIIKVSFFGVKAFFGITKDLGRRSFEAISPLMTLSRNRSDGSSAPICIPRTDDLPINYLPSQILGTQDGFDIQRVPSSVEFSSLNNNVLNSIVDIAEDPDIVESIIMAHFSVV